MKKILITGGAGFIGSNIALKLKDKGFDVTVLDNLSPQIHGENPETDSPLYQSIKSKVTFIKGTVCSKEDWVKALQNQDAVIHLAAETGTGQSMYEIQRYIDVNVGGTAILLDLLANTKHRIKKVIVASSRAIYGEGKYQCELHGIVYPTTRSDFDMQNGDFNCKCPVCGKTVKLLPTDESSKIHPSSVYGITKQSQEQLVLTVCQALNIGAVAFRYQNVYGPGQSLTNPYTGILSIFSTRIMNGKSINIFEDGVESRDFVYINDVVDATIIGLEKEVAEGNVYNIGTGESTDVITVAKTLCANYNKQIDIVVSGNYRVGDIRHNFADISLANDHLDYTPVWTFQKGIYEFCSWVKDQKVSDDNYEKSISEMKQKGLYK